MKVNKKGIQCIHDGNLKGRHIFVVKAYHQNQDIKCPSRALVSLFVPLSAMKTRKKKKESTVPLPASSRGATPYARPRRPAGPSSCSIPAGCEECRMLPESSSYSLLFPRSSLAVAAVSTTTPRGCCCCSCSILSSCLLALLNQPSAR